MRVSELIEQLRILKGIHGDVHIRAFDRRGDSGRPRVKQTTIMKSGNKRTTVQWEVSADDR